ncbi:MAG: hypothetical protein CL928_18765 [Deltaproteobacteria bacterium]|nr:hypothetical protein [Deltaproteobacteria bacterium]
MIGIGLMKSCYFLTDSYWIGQLGPLPLAALGGSAFAWWMIFTLCRLPGTGVNALVARHEGAGTQQHISGVISQGLWFAFGIAVLLVVAAFPFRGIYFDLLGFQPGSEEHALGMEFLGASLLGASTLAAHSVTNAAFRGLGDTRTALSITAATLVVNACLDPILIWGWGGLPALGIAGAAWATAIANGLGAVLGFRILGRRGHGLRLGPPATRLLQTLGRIGAPVSAEGLSFSMVYVLLGQIINDFGTHNMAALGVGHRLESLAFMVCVGFQVGAATMVGQHLGAGSPKTAARCAHRAATLGCAVMVPIAVFLYAFAPQLFALFVSGGPTHTTEALLTASAGSLYLRIQCAVFVFMALEVIYQGAFAGAGDTLPAFWIGFGFTSARIPLAWAFAYPMGMGIDGVWIAIAVSTVIKGVLSWAWFRRGRWASALSDQALRVETAKP